MLLPLFQSNKQVTILDCNFLRAVKTSALKREHVFLVGKLHILSFIITLSSQEVASVRPGSWFTAWLYRPEYQVLVKAPFTHLQLFTCNHS